MVRVGCMTHGELRRDVAVNGRHGDLLDLDAERLERLERRRIVAPTAG